MTALLGLVALAGYQNRDKLSELLSGVTNNPKQQSGSSASPLEGVLGNIKGLLGSSGAGGLLGGGIGQLIETFKQNGHQEAAQSWVNSGPNKDISSSDLETAIGPETLKQLEQQTGLSQQELLSRLSRELPSAIDKYTPDGRVPA